MIRTCLASEILKKWPLLLLPRSKKNLFWSTLITFETAKLPISSGGTTSADLSTFKSPPVAAWELSPDIKPAPTSSDNPTRRSDESEFCCFEHAVQKETTKRQNVLVSHPLNKRQTYNPTLQGSVCKCLCAHQLEH